MEHEIPVVRRAAALKHAFSHITPTIWPGELLIGGKSSYYRGSFPMPWLSEGFFIAKEDELNKEASDKGEGEPMKSVNSEQEGEMSQKALVMLCPLPENSV